MALGTLRNFFTGIGISTGLFSVLNSVIISHENFWCFFIGSTAGILILGTSIMFMLDDMGVGVRK